MAQPRNKRYMSCVKSAEVPKEKNERSIQGDTSSSRAVNRVNTLIERSPPSKKSNSNNFAAEPMLRKTVSKIRESDFDVSDLMNPNEKLVFDKYVKDYEEEMKKE